MLYETRNCAVAGESTDIYNQNSPPTTTRRGGKYHSSVSQSEECGTRSEEEKEDPRAGVRYLTKSMEQNCIACVYGYWREQCENERQQRSVCVCVCVCVCVFEETWTTGQGRGVVLYPPPPTQISAWGSRAREAKSKLARKYELDIA